MGMLTANSAFSSREFLRLIEGSGLVGTWGWTFATNEHVWSVGLWRLLGMEPGDLAPSYRAFLDFVHPDDRASLATAAEIVRGHVPENQVFRIIRPDGALRTLSSRHEMYVTPAGQPRSTACMVIDATDQKTLARAQAAEARRRRALFEEHRIISYAISAEGRLAINAKLSELTGISVDDLRADPFVAFVEREREHWREVSARSRQEGQAYALHPTVRLADGREERFSTWCVPVRNAAGEIEDWSGIMHPTEAGGPLESDRLRHGLEQAVEGRHIRAGRALLDWSMTDLAGASGLSLSTIRRLEDGAEAPAERSRHRAIEALRAGGIAFTFTDAGTIALAKI